MNINVINQAHFSVKACRSKNDGLRDLRNGLQGFRVDKLKVIDGEVLRSVGEEVVFGAPQIDGRILFSGERQVAGCRECPLDSWRVFAVLRSQADVSGGKGEAIGFPNRWVAHDFDGDVQIANHPLDEGDLLKVLISKNSVGGLEKIEELQDNGEDSIEMTRAARTAQVFGEKRFGDEDRVIGMVEEFFFRSEGEIDSFLFAEREIGLQWSRILGQISDSIELNRVDEDRDRDSSSGADQLAGSTDQSQMSLVKRPHGGDQSEGSGQVSGHLRDGCDFRSDFDHVVNVVNPGQNSTRKLKKSTTAPVYWPLGGDLAPGESRREARTPSPWLTWHPEFFIKTPASFISNKLNMKKPLLNLLFALFFLTPVVHGQQRLKIATVSMERLFNEYHQTSKVQREINIERARIQRDNNERLAKIREIDSQLQKIREELKKEDIGEKEKVDFIAESNGLAQDGKSKERERKEFLSRRNRALSEKMRKQMRGILVKIQRTVSDRAKEGNYDFIFDASGNSNQGIPFVLHARETTDLTNSLLAEINEGSEGE